MTSNDQWRANQAADRLFETEEQERAREEYDAVARAEAHLRPMDAGDCGAIDCVNNCDGGHDYADCPNVQRKPHPTTEGRRANTESQPQGGEG